METISQIPIRIIKEQELIIGPLGREAAEAVMRQANIKVPTLMLNHTDEDPGAISKYLFEFGLPPEQEARQVRTILPRNACDQCYSFSQMRLLRPCFRSPFPI